MSLPPRRLGALLAWALAVWMLVPPSFEREPGPPPGLGRRLLGPVASLVASVEASIRKFLLW